MRQARRAATGWGLAAALASAAAAGAPPAALEGIPRYGHVVVIVEENKDYEQVLNRAVAPNIARLAARYGNATRFYGEVHPSEANYVALLAGDTFGLHDDDAYYCRAGDARPFCDHARDPGYRDHTVAARHLGDQLVAAGLTWKGYYGSLPAPGSGAVTATDPAYPAAPATAAFYASKHSGFMNFADVQADPLRAERIVGMDRFDADLAGGTLPAFSLVVPNQCDEMHGLHGPGIPADCDGASAAPLIRRGDAYVGALVRRIQAGRDWRGSADMAIVITFDEGARHGREGCCGAVATPGSELGGGHIPTIVVTNHGPRGVVDDTPYNHYSLLRTLEDAFGIDEHLRHAGADTDGVRPMVSLFARARSGGSRGRWSARSRRTAPSPAPRRSIGRRSPLPHWNAMELTWPTATSGLVDDARSVRTMRLARRDALMLLAAGPAAALAAPPRGGFTHDVASGEPTARSVLLWTRYASAGGVRLRAEVAPDDRFAHVVAGGEVEASPARDGCAKLTVAGLEPGRWYAYRFIAPDGTISPVGRTRTLPEGACSRFAMGVFSCSNMPFGYFNAYAHAAARDDIDLMLHLGDYLYEYDRGHYPTPAEAVTSRWPEPATELVHLADYRARYASYRRDPDLRRLHNRFPMIAMWDDHESANDSWSGGAENHQPATEGDWTARKRAAVQAYREWMPVSDRDWASWRIGDLATLFRPEERLTARTKQVDLVGAYVRGGDAGMAAFRHDVWEDPAHTLFGAVQERWFAETMRTAAATTRWQVLAQQVNVGFTRMPADAARWVKPGDKAAAAYIGAGIAAARAGMPFNMDSWNGYPAARSRMLRGGLDADANLVVLSGDSHNAWAFDLAEGGTPAGVEFGGHSVTSPGYEAELAGVPPADVARALIGSSPELRWAETARRGYMTVELTPERATAEWLFLDTIRQRSTTIAARHRAGVSRGARRLDA